MNTRTGRTKQARARKVGESVSYRVWIVGQTWQGFKGSYDYTFDHEPTIDEIVKGAGDFQGVIDYQINRVTTIRYTDGDRRIVKTIRPWDSAENGDFCCDAYGC